MKSLIELYISNPPYCLIFCKKTYLKKKNLGHECEKKIKHPRVIVGFEPITFVLQVFRPTTLPTELFCHICESVIF